jgi:transposase
MDELIAAREKISQLEARVAQLSALVEKLAAQVAWFKRQTYGRKSEQLPLDAESQGFLKLEDSLIEREAAKVDPEPRKPKGGSRKGRKTRSLRLPPDLPVREETLVPLPVQLEPEAWRRINEEVTQRLEIEPGSLYLPRLVRPTYVRHDQPYAAPVTAPAPPALVAGQFFGPGLITEFCLDKFLSHQPLYRQRQGYLWKYGVDIPLSTLCETIGGAAREVTLLVQGMAAQMWAGGYVQIDLTPIRYLGNTRKDGSAAKGQMWVATVPGGDVIYHWRLSKSAQEAETIIPVSFRGIIQCDGGSEMACWFQGGKGRRRPPPKGVSRAGCMTHVRRKFEDAYEQSGRKCEISHQFLLKFGELYKIEAQARATGLSGEAFYQLRLERRQAGAVAMMAALRKLLLEESPKQRPTSRLGKAIAHALSQWESLQIYLGNGKVEIDNNPVENAIRPSALGKKNYLFMGAAHSGHWAAAFYSLLGSCLRRDINPREYLRWLFAKLPTATNQNVGELSPAAYAALRPKSAVTAVA